MPWPSMKATMSSFTVVRSSGVGDMFGKARKQLLYALRKFGASARPAKLVGGRGSSHQRDKHAIELFGVEVELNFYWLRGWTERIPGFPRESISIASATVDVDAHVTSFATRNQS